MSDFTPSDLEKEREMWRKAMMEAVAKEAARWSEALIPVTIFEKWTFGVVLGPLWKLLEPVLPHGDNGAHGKDIHIFASLSKLPLESDWLAQHDASVAAQAVKPWRDGVENLKRLTDADGSMADRAVYLYCDALLSLAEEKKI